MPTTPDTVALAAVAILPATVLTSSPWPIVVPSTLTPTPPICVATPNNAGFSVTKRLRAVTKEVKTFDPFCFASYRSQMFRMSSASLQSLAITHQLDKIGRAENVPSKDFHSQDTHPLRLTDKGAIMIRNIWFFGNDLDQ